MFKVKWENEYRSGSTPKWSFALDKNSKVCEFPKRQKAAQWIRNHRWFGAAMYIIHPNGDEELFPIGE